MNKKLLIFIFFLVSLLFVTCGKQPSKLETQKAPLAETTPLTIWWNRGYYLEEDEALQKVITEWQEKTNHKVELLFFCEDDILQVGIDALAKGKP
ncbi:MAG: carbohydrate ABC transporter substrate-binding protein, partial [Okeania sp. SIO2D1]|nr:carbohydrate ABC transporter substrate-binding protein [Okeania sp. SIO2D1]